jgi:hypothetical protein
LGRKNRLRESCCGICVCFFRVYQICKKRKTPDKTGAKDPMDCGPIKDFWTLESGFSRLLGIWKASERSGIGLRLPCLGLHNQFSISVWFFVRNQLTNLTPETFEKKYPNLDAVALYWLMYAARRRRLTRTPMRRSASKGGGKGGLKCLFVLPCVQV